MTRQSAAVLFAAAFLMTSSVQAQKVARASVGISIDRIAVIDARLSGDRDVTVLWTTNLDEQPVNVSIANAPVGLDGIDVTPTGSFGEHRSLVLRPAVVAGAGPQSFGTVSRSAGGANLSITLRWSAEARPVPVSLQFSLPGSPRASATVIIR